jgi:hypothetical protein
MMAKWKFIQKRQQNDVILRMHYFKTCDKKLGTGVKKKAQQS